MFHFGKIMLVGGAPFNSKHPANSRQFRVHASKRAQNGQVRLRMRGFLPDVGAGQAEAIAEAFPKNETLGPWRFVIGECHVVVVNINGGVALK